MQANTVAKLINLNNNFYQTVAKDFSVTRQTNWAGWETWYEILNKKNVYNRKLKIVDIASGNLRLKKFLDNKKIIYDYLGIDNCEHLLQLSNQNQNLYQNLDILSSLVDGVEWTKQVKQQNNDLTCCFGFLHHIPSNKLRLQFLHDLFKLTKKNGYLIITFWQFLRDPNLVKRIQNPQLVNLDNNDLEVDDYILDWKKGKLAYRYCHNFSDDEIKTTLDNLPPHQLIGSYNSDGATHNLNKYLILQKTQD